ncbi:hypothetical protein GCM10025783_18320 [Amnibacterium soli]|uniref:FAD dependent oxidoreductase domain-containing protein n=1 Tax=Amnibacterium soli TaxID=1282736 RepID=A0ABP8Z4Y0_9MICO
MPQTVFDRPLDDRLVDAALAGSRPGSFWLERTPGERRPALTADLDCDLLVVGGGYTGLWTALQAKRRDPGARVVVLEARTNGWAASGRNGGFVEASLTHGESNGRTRFASDYDALDADGLANLDAMEADVLGFARTADWERTGVLGVATEPHQVPWMQEDADGERGRFLDGPAMRAEVASPTFLAGVERPRDAALVDPARLADALADACATAGVELFERTPVLGIERADRGVLARTATARVRADRVALGTNVFPSLLKRLRLYTVPVYDYVLMTEPLSAADRAAIGWRGRQGIGDSGNQFHYYRLTTTGSCGAGTTRSTTTAGGCGRSTRSGRRRSASWPGTSRRRSPSSSTCASPTAGRGRSTPAAGSAPSSARRSAAAPPTRSASPASESLPRTTPRT